MVLRSPSIWLGYAADIVVRGVKPKVVGAFFGKLFVGTGGIVFYDGFTHMDVREVISRWVG